LASRRAPITCAGETGGTEIHVPSDDADQINAKVRAVLRDVLGLSAERVAQFRDATPLFGALPELDSMAVAGVLTELEDRLGIVIEDDEVDGEMLETFGALTAFARAKAQP
jgi:acyl carrier protein